MEVQVSHGAEDRGLGATCCLMGICQCDSSPGVGSGHDWGILSDGTGIMWEVWSKSGGL